MFFLVRSDGLKEICRQKKGGVKKLGTLLEVERRNW